VAATEDRPVSSRSTKLISWITLSALPGWSAAAVIGVMFPVSWAAAFYLGGGTLVAPHWFYVPVFLAGLRFGPVGALLAGVVSTFVAGPLLPADSATGAPQAVSDWVSRGIFFILIGQFVTQLFGAVRRTSAQVAQAEALTESEQRFRALVQGATDMIVVVDAEDVLQYESPAVQRILGWKPGQRLGLRGDDFVHPDDRKAASVARASALASPGNSRTVELRQLDHAGGWHWVESTATNMVDEPTVHGIVIHNRVVDERKVLEQELTQRAFHDHLTGLANRGFLRSRLEAALVRPDLCRPALLFIDVDDFKTVNDGLGHDAGDCLLIEVAARLRSCVRAQDLVARLGGDEFAVLVEEGPDPSAAATEIAARFLDALGQTFDVFGHETHVSVSIGLAVHHDATPDADMLLRQADLAMYHAKASGKAQYAVFSESMHEIVRHRLDIEAGLWTALQDREIRVLYQPIVALATHKIEAVEALVRWQHPTRGLLSPAEFLDVAEVTGLIVPLGQFVLEEACAQVQRWRVHLDPEIKVSVNLSATQLGVPGIVEDVRDALQRAGVSADALILEVTEAALIDDVAGIAATLESLRSLGVSIAIDDFGTGYSSLSHLKRFPIDVIKIDKSFVDGVCRGAEEATLARAVLALGEEFQLQVVAEGIESEDQDAELRWLGCSHGQGFLFARPMGAGEIDELLATDGIAAPAEARLPSSVAGTTEYAV
jgi:diguanylate cyclase (GGDEF)-like protein/PAS domain S-box-containing protein